MHISTQLSLKGESSTTNEFADCWKHLRALPTTNAVKNFLWRHCTNSLPTKPNLYKRNITADPLCPICLTEDESVGHILWSCPSVVDVWVLGAKSLQKASITDLDFAQVYKQV